MRICYVNTTPTGRNGITGVAFGYIKELSGKPGCVIDYVAINDADADYREIIESAGGRFYVFRRLSRPLSYLFKLKKALTGCDILHIHGNSATMLLELLAARMAHVPVRISHGHATGCSFKLLDKLCRPLFYRLTTHRLACGEKAGQWLYGEQSFSVFRNGLRADGFSFSGSLREEVRKEYGIEGGRVLLNIANFDPPKNHPFLLRVFKKVLETEPDAVLLLAGGGDARAELEGRCRELGLENNVRFLGSVSATRPLLCAADLFLLPSLREGVPVTVLEAQCCSLPCFISDAVSPEAVFTDAVTMLPLEEEAWAAAIAGFTPAERAEAPVSIPAGYDISAEAERLYTFYTEAINRQHPAP